MRSFSHAAVAVAACALALAGCVTPNPVTDAAAQLPDVGLETTDLTIDGVMGFLTSVVEPATHFALGLYEPTIDVSDTGVIYISAHTIGVDTTGAPAFFSADDGKTWQQLPFAGPATVPEPVHGGTPPPSDEIFIVAGDDGTAWGVDITLAAYPVNGWCNDGGDLCYHNPNAFNRADATEGCSVASLNDRPWAAAANGKLLLVNNPGSGEMQIAAIDVPPATPIGAATPATGPQWNMCASSGGFIPGIPDMREDHFFAVPQVQGENLVIVTGYADDVFDVQERIVFKNSHVSASQISAYGQVVFDATGTMFIATMNNEAAEAGEGAGGIHLAVSTDDGETFTEHTYRFDQPVTSVYIDGNKQGAGAIINFGLLDEAGTDWYLGHLLLSDEGGPIVRNVALAVDDGPEASRHVQGAAVGPDGRAYMVMSEVSGNDQQESLQQTGITPLSVVVQLDGIALPVTLPDLVDA